MTRKKTTSRKKTTGRRKTGGRSASPTSAGLRDQINALRKIQGSPTLSERKPIVVDRPITTEGVAAERMDYHRARKERTLREWDEYQQWLRTLPTTKQKTQTLELSTHPETGEWFGLGAKKTFTRNIPWDIDIRSSGRSKDPSLVRHYSSKDFEELESPMKVEWNRPRILRGFGYKYGRPMLVEMSPDDFLGFAYPLSNQVIAESSLITIRQGLDDGNVFDVPRLEVDINGVAIGEHEGRHRALVLKERGIDKMPVVLYDQRYKEYDHRLYEPDYVLEKIREK
jgi:hypothetical protein